MEFLLIFNFSLLILRCFRVLTYNVYMAYNCGVHDNFADSKPSR